MPRQSRLKSPTDYYHVMVRGNNKEKILKNPNQKNFFLDCLKEQLKDDKLEIAAYCIMDNHVHLVVKAKFEDLSISMKRINTKYAMMINYQQDRIGHVFQGRYKSEAITDDKYLLNVIRYVHNNPLRAKIINSLDLYKWSSFNDYVKNNKIVNSIQKEIVLGYFYNINKFIEFHKDKDDNEYLDTKEEIEEYRIALGQIVISNYFKEKGINGMEEIAKRQYHVDEIIKRLLDKTKLSHRQIAKLLNINHNLVHQVSIEAKKQ